MSGEIEIDLGIELPIELELTTEPEIFIIPSEIGAIIKGAKGDKGDRGDDGFTPYIQDGFWFINGENTTIVAVGQAGINGLNGADGKDGINGLNGSNGADGINGINGITPHIDINGNWFIWYSNINC